MKPIKLKKETIFIIIMLILSIPQLLYRFSHPEMSETNLFLNFFEAYRAFCRIEKAICI